MPKAESFILTSDFATLKNDDTKSIDVVLPASVVIAPGTLYNVSADLTIGAPGAEQRVKVKSSRIGAKYFTGMFNSTWEGTTPFGPAIYTSYARAIRISPTVVRCIVTVPNPYPDPLTTGISETFSFIVNTFLPPAG